MEKIKMWTVYFYGLPTNGPYFCSQEGSTTPIDEVGGESCWCSAAVSIMRILATKLNSYLCRRTPGIGPPSRNFSSLSSKDELALEEAVERKIGWVLKLFFVGTATFVGYQFFPYLGENVMQQSVSLLHVKDPLFKRMGASRLARFAIDDDRRMKIVEIGGAQELLNMLGAAKDDKTRQEALKALTALSLSDKALGALHRAGAVSVIRATPESVENQEVMKYKTNLLKRFQDSSYDISS